MRSLGGAYISQINIRMMVLSNGIASCYGFSYYYRFSDIAINSFNPSFI